jgi:hypothetical protein
MAFGWIGATTAFGSVVRNANRSFVVFRSFTFRTEVQHVQMPAKNASGRLSSRANQPGGREPSAATVFRKARERYDAPARNAEPGPPVWRG